MYLNKFLKTFIFASAIAFVGCESDDNTQAPLGSYDNGILVLNEGGTGEVTYINNDLTTVQQNIFGTVNGDENNLGQYTQSIFFEGERAFIISNGSNKITVVNRNTFEYIATISTGFGVPRYGVAYNGKAYVTNLNSFTSSTDDFVSVVDLNSLTVIGQIDINDYAERIVEADGQLYVSSGSFGSGNKITVIDPVNETVTETINVGTAPNSLEERAGTLYVLCGSFSDNSKIVKIDTDTNEIIEEIVFPSTMGNASNLDVAENRMYFTVGPRIYSVEVNADQVTDVPLVNTNSTSLYIGYGFAVDGNRIYISEAADDFASDGKIFIYSTSGEMIDEIPVGLGPNGFYFN